VQAGQRGHAAGRARDDVVLIVQFDRGDEQTGQLLREAEQFRVRPQHAEVGERVDRSAPAGEPADAVRAGAVPLDLPQQRPGGRPREVRVLLLPSDPAEVAQEERDSGRSVVQVLSQHRD
jgi:hypothetical protein